MLMGLIYHITEAARWDAARRQGVYWPAAFGSDGFIHCSTAAQVVGVANNLYRGQAGLVLLVIDAARVDAPVVYEDLYGAGVDFPHIYGPLPASTVLTALPFTPNEDGCFTLPAFTPTQEEE